MKNGKSRLTAQAIDAHMDRMFELSRKNLERSMLAQLVNSERDELDIQFEGIDDDYIGNNCIDSNRYTKFDVMNRYPDSNFIHFDWVSK